MNNRIQAIQTSTFLRELYSHFENSIDLGFVCCIPLTLDFHTQCRVKCMASGWLARENAYMS